MAWAQTNASAPATATATATASASAIVLPVDSVYELTGTLGGNPHRWASFNRLSKRGDGFEFRGFDLQKEGVEIINRRTVFFIEKNLGITEGWLQDFVNNKEVYTSHIKRVGSNLEIKDRRTDPVSNKSNENTSKIPVGPLVVSSATLGLYLEQFHSSGPSDFKFELLSQGLLGFMMNEAKVTRTQTKDSLKFAIAQATTAEDLTIDLKTHKQSAVIKGTGFESVLRPSSFAEVSKMIPIDEAALKSHFGGSSPR